MMALGGVTYLDRVCISILAPNIMRDLSIDTVQMSYVFSAFTFAYAIFEMPTAWWADRVGSRKVLTRIVVWWSAFTMLTAAAFSYSTMLVVRWLFGMGEAGAWPNVARIFSRWIPKEERGRTQGIFFAGAHIAGGLTPVVVAWIATLMPWRWVFVFSGAVGLVWATAFYRWFRDEPRNHPSVSKNESDFIESRRMAIAVGHGEWHKVFRAPGLLPLCLQYFANNCGFYFFITWLPGSKSTKSASSVSPSPLKSAAIVINSLYASAKSTKSESSTMVSLLRSHGHAPATTVNLRTVEPAGVVPAIPSPLGRLAGSSGANTSPSSGWPDATEVGSLTRLTE